MIQRPDRQLGTGVFVLHELPTAAKNVLHGISNWMQQQIDDQMVLVDCVYVLQLQHMCWCGQSHGQFRYSVDS